MKGYLTTITHMLQYINPIAYFLFNINIYFRKQL